MVKARSQANASSPQGAWLAFFLQVIVGASDDCYLFIGSSAFIEEYARTRQIPVPKLLLAFGVNLVQRYWLSRATLC